MKIPSFDTQPKDKAYSGYGKAMLSKMGWKEGDGLGKNRQGMAEAIKVKKREHQEGLGAEDSLRYKWEEKWWEGHFASAADKFARAANLAQDDAKRSSSSSSSSSDDSDDDDDTARNLAACAVDHNGNAVLATGSVKGRDGVYYSGKRSDFELAAELASEAKGGGGFFGRAKGKLARVASMEAEQLKKYGIQAGEPLENLEKEAKRDRARAEAAAEADDPPGSPDAAAETKKTDPSADAPPLTGEAYEGAPSSSTRSLEWWVNARFLWGGLVGSARERDGEVRRRDAGDKRGFTEDDQEALFHATHAGKVEKGAKRGLGGKGQIKSAFAGKKMRFDEGGASASVGAGGRSAAEGDHPRREKRSSDAGGGEEKAKKAKKEKKRDSREKSAKKEKKRDSREKSAKKEKKEDSREKSAKKAKKDRSGAKKPK